MMIKILVQTLLLAIFLVSAERNFNEQDWFTNAESFVELSKQAIAIRMIPELCMKIGVNRMNIAQENVFNDFQVCSQTAMKNAEENFNLGLRIGRWHEEWVDCFAESEKHFHDAVEDAKAKAKACKL